MGSPCTICEHPKLDEIDAAILSGEGLREIAKRLDLGDHTKLHRHKQRGHLPTTLSQSQAVDGTSSTPLRGVRTVDRVDRLTGKLDTFIDEAEKAGKPAQFLQAMKEMRPYLELYAKLRGELDERPQVMVNLFEDPHMGQTLAILWDELAGHPEIKARVAQRLQALKPSPALEARTS